MHLLKLSSFIRVLFSGPLIAALAYNGVSLIYKGKLSSVKFPEGWAFIVFLSLLPFIPAMIFHYLAASKMDRAFRIARLKGEAAFLVASVLTMIIFSWSAYAEHGPYLGGGAAMSLVLVIPAVIVVAVIATMAGVLSSVFFK